MNKLNLNLNLNFFRNNNKFLILISLSLLIQSVILLPILNTKNQIKTLSDSNDLINFDQKINKFNYPKIDSNLPKNFQSSESYTPKRQHELDDHPKLYPKIDHQPIQHDSFSVNSINLTPSHDHLDHLNHLQPQIPMAYPYHPPIINSHPNLNLYGTDSFVTVNFHHPDQLAHDL
ncbi:hypothetical protein O181_130152 [Austropuccinia psidii MF-1]|uniref:Uncharacterized protein n=1 Tax=Austropuccinia psidii MF-1 TaxID=1389203 RepID=A0A9Q3QC74_9BASI|nr:hypothetical protein [Austropuccinia psidii MF-1]